jgi:HSP20 family protein
MSIARVVKVIAFTGSYQEFCIGFQNTGLINSQNKRRSIMSLIKWSPETSFFPSISNWMDDFFPGNDDWPKTSVKGVSIPAVNVTENKDAFKLKVAAPGFRKEDFKLEVQNGCLTISGETKEEKEDKDEKYTRQEYRYSSFSRSFTLPENVKSDGIAAEYADGVLKVKLPKKKAEEKPVTQIAVK